MDAMEDILSASGSGREQQRTPVVQLQSASIEHQLGLTAAAHAGRRIARALAALSADTSLFNAPNPSRELTSQCLASWEKMVRTTETSTAALQRRINTALLQYMISINSMGRPDLSESEIQQFHYSAEHCIQDIVHYLMSHQYQLSVAYCEIVGPPAPPVPPVPPVPPYDADGAGAPPQGFPRPHDTEPRSSSVSPHHFARHYPRPRMLLQAPPHSYGWPLPHLVHAIPFFAMPQQLPPGRFSPVMQGHGNDNRTFGSGSSDGQYTVPPPIVHSPGEAYRYHEMMRQRAPTDGFRPVETRGPSPLNMHHEGFEGRRGPLPPPGMLTATHFRTTLSCSHRFHLEVQRRSSEILAAERRASQVEDNLMRRWSMPYDVYPACFHTLAHAQPAHAAPLARQQPRRTSRPPRSNEHSRSATPEWQMECDTRQNGVTFGPPGVWDALQLLSMRPWPFALAGTTHNAPSQGIHQGIAEVWPEDGDDISFGQRMWLPTGPPTGPPAGDASGSDPVPSGARPNAGQMREFSLFGDDDTLSCLRNVTSWNN